MRMELYRLQLGAPRPSVVEMRRHLREALEQLGAEEIWEARCPELETSSDPRADHVLLTGRLPSPWGNLLLEAWPWEEGDELYCRITWVGEDPNEMP